MLMEFAAPDIYTSPPVWHPNIDYLSGHVFLPIDWSPVLKLYSVIFAIQVTLLFYSSLAVIIGF